MWSIYECRNWTPDMRFVSDSAEGQTNFSLLPLKNVGRAEQQRTGKQGRDDSIKHISIRPHPAYLSTLKGGAVY